MPSIQNLFTTYAEYYDSYLTVYDGCKGDNQCIHFLEKHFLSKLVVVIKFIYGIIIKIYHYGSLKLGIVAIDRYLYKKFGCYGSNKGGKWCNTGYCPKGNEIGEQGMGITGTPAIAMAVDEAPEDALDGEEVD
mmetsp:Transcript_25300/g.62640  ORF Transcript_25300/g.62640 Transcript_25300/m.62640 type:complete len:133 (-) Transcript_25300:382-780(-)